MVLFTTFDLEIIGQCARYTTLYLPAVALIMAQGVLKVPWRKVKLVALVVLVAFGLVQFFVLSYDAFWRIPSRFEVNLPSIGPVGLFARGDFIQWPNSGPTDDDYWVVDDVLDRVMADSSAGEGGQIKIGLLDFYEGQFRFVAATEYPALSVTDLQHDDGLPMYPRVFAMDYIVLLKSGRFTKHQVRAIGEVIKDPSDPFHKEFRLINEFPFPAGEVVQLYRNVGHRVPGHVPESTLRFTHVGYVRQVHFGNKILFVGYTLKEGAPKNKVVLDLYWVCREPMSENYTVYLKVINGAYHVWGQQDGIPGGLPTNSWEKGQSIRDHREIEILPGTLPGSYLIEVTLYDLYRQIELKPESESQLLLGPITIPPYALASVESLDIEHPVEATLDGKVRLLGYNVESGFRPGDNIHLTLFWQALGVMDKDYTVFTHLTDAEGRTWGQKDNPPVDGFYPTTGWQAGLIVRDQYDFLISSDAPPGEYQLEVGMYLAETGARLAVLNEAGQVMDRVSIDRIQIKPADSVDHKLLPLDLQSSGQAADCKSAASKNVIY